MPSEATTVRAFDAARDLAWAQALLDRDFGGRVQARRSECIDVLALPGFVAERGGRAVGLLTYRRGASECEIPAPVPATARNRGHIGG